MVVRIYDRSFNYFIILLILRGWCNPMLPKVLLFLSGCGIAISAAIPSFLHVCHRSDPNLNECIVNAVEALKPKLKEGIPELHMPALEPLPLSEIKLRSGPGQVKINADFSNVELWGALQLKVLDFKSNIPQKTFQVKVLLPYTYFKGNYNMEVSVLMVNYKGQGIAIGNFTDYIFDATFNYHLISKGDKEYMNFSKIKLGITQGKTFLDAEFSGSQDSALLRGIREILNDNSDLFLSEIRPALEEGLSVRFTEIANNVTHSFPYEELLPE